MMRRLFDGEARRYLAGGSVSLLGGGLLAIPLFDIWEDVSLLSWNLLTSLVENLLFVLLTLVLIAGGVWLVRSDWATDEVATVARRTVAGTLLVAVLIGWAVFVQLWAMHALKPYVIAMDGVLIGAVTAFGLSVSTVRADAFRAAAEEERSMNERLELLYRAAGDLEAVATPEAAYDIVESAVAEVVGDRSFRVIVDGEVVVDHGPDTADGARLPDASTTLTSEPPIEPGEFDLTGGSPRSDGGDGVIQPAATVSISPDDRIELFDGPYKHHEIVTVELFASYLDDTLERIERETALRDERNILEFTNRTLRHDLMGDLSLVQARLNMIDRNVTFEDESHAEHLSVALDRIDEMDEFVRTMRTYMESVLSDDHTLDAVALAPIVEDHAESIRAAYPDAEVVVEELPEVAVVADELLDRVFVNLLNNALEHNDSPTPRVTISAERLGDAVLVRVADNGPGISAERRASIFQRGERGTESDGTGFGLYLVKDVVENYGGEVRITDNEPRGVIFELELPLAGERS